MSHELKLGVDFGQSRYWSSTAHHSMKAVSSIPLVILPTAMASFFHCYFSLTFSMTIFFLYFGIISYRCLEVYSINYTEKHTCNMVRCEG